MLLQSWFLSSEFLFKCTRTFQAIYGPRDSCISFNVVDRFPLKIFHNVTDKSAQNWILMGDNYLALSTFKSVHFRRWSLFCWYDYSIHANNSLFKFYHCSIIELAQCLYNIRNVSTSVHWNLTFVYQTFRHEFASVSGYTSCVIVWLFEFPQYE